MNLTSKKCVPCEGGMPPLSKEEVTKYLKELPHWSLNWSDHLFKKFTFRDFKDALDFVNKVGKIAEEEGHHPDIMLAWGKVVVTLWTHAINGLSENDFILAAKIDTLIENK